jgi:hypothetical protein
MNLLNIMPFFTVVVMAILTVDVFRRYLSHHGGHTYLLIWGIGLTMFTLATLSEGLLGQGWNEWVFRAWYLFGAILSAAWIGQGTVHLLARRSWARVSLVILIIASLAAVALMLATPLADSAFVLGQPVSLQYRNILPEGGVRLSTIPFNIYGTITLVGGALWSGYLFWRKRVLPNRVVGNVLIAAGALAIATASSLARLGNGEFLALGQLLFAVLIYVGFVLASKPAAEEVRAAAAAQTAHAQ